MSDLQGFASNDELLGQAMLLLTCREAARKAREDIRIAEKDRKRAVEADSAATRAWHEALECSGDEASLVRHLNTPGLTPVEKEMLVTLLLSGLGLVDGRVQRPSDILKSLDIRGTDALCALRSLSEEGRLYRTGLILYDDDDEPLQVREISPDPALVEEVLYACGSAREGWQVETEEELHGCLPRLVRSFKKKADCFESYDDGYRSIADCRAARQSATRALVKLDATLQSHPGWKLSEVFREVAPASLAGEVVVVLLLARELGQLPADDELFQGLNLARAGVPRPELARHVLDDLGPDGFLVQGGWVRPCGGPSEMADDDPRILAETEFCLTREALEKLGIDPKTAAMARLGKSRLTEPRFGLDRLVLPPSIRRALDMIHVQARHGRVLLDAWGLGGAIPYGRCLTLLFSGPPGTGKTACAEAIAHELGKPLLTADYAAIQNCFVGQTEKNVVQSFRDAKATEAVLFWDEADAMFFDRDAASRNWEVRTVNVLLQEIERFEGVCILATNRKVTLDRAFERRIALRLEFDWPDYEARLSIWRLLIPETMPLGDDVRIEALADHDLSGGQIKNVVLNAARRALLRGPEGPVIMEDFEEALDLERDGALGCEGNVLTGFGG